MANDSKFDMAVAFEGTPITFCGLALLLLGDLVKQEYTRYDPTAISPDSPYSGFFLGEGRLKALADSGQITRVDPPVDISSTQKPMAIYANDAFRDQLAKSVSLLREMPSSHPLVVNNLTWHATASYPDVRIAIVPYKDASEMLSRWSGLLAGRAFNDVRATFRNFVDMHGFEKMTKLSDSKEYKGFEMALDCAPLRSPLRLTGCRLLLAMLYKSDQKDAAMKYYETFFKQEFMEDQRLATYADFVKSEAFQNELANLESWSIQEVAPKYQPALTLLHGAPQSSLGEPSLTSAYASRYLLAAEYGSLFGTAAMFIERDRDGIPATYQGREK